MMLRINEFLQKKTFKRKDCLTEVQGEVHKLIEQKFVVEVPTEKVNHDAPEWYLPLQDRTTVFFFTPDRTTKVRLVFDASVKVRNGKSLNDHLEKGPNFIKSLPDVLMAWRFDKVAYTGDMRKMFNKVMIHPDDQVFHRFLWRTNDSEQLRVYQWVRFNLRDKPFTRYRSCSSQDPGQSLGRPVPRISQIALYARLRRRNWRLQRERSEVQANCE